jgi:hypothetical protein
MKRWLIAVLCLIPALALAEPSGVVRIATDQALEAVYDKSSGGWLQTR